MNNRRKLVVALGAGALAFPFAALAQPRGKTWRIGILNTESRDSSAGRIASFVRGLRERGLVEGKNIVIDQHNADNDFKLLGEMASDLVQQHVDVIFAPNRLAVRAVMKANANIPIVFSQVGNPVEEGFASSLARPGGNITGTASIGSEITAKRLGILKEAFPGASRVVVVAPYGSPPEALEELRRAAKKIGLQLLFVDWRGRQDMEAAFQNARKWRADALFIISATVATNDRTLLAELASKLRLPSIGGVVEFAEAGGLMSYGPNFELLYYRAASYVEKILRGAKAGDLPIERPTQFDFVINMKTANALGLKIPQSILLQATRVIE